MVDNYAPLVALRRRGPERELAWHAPDDRVPGRALWSLWARHVSLRLAQRVGRLPRGPVVPARRTGIAVAAPGTATAEKTPAAKAGAGGTDAAVVRPRGGPVPRTGPRATRMPVPASGVRPPDRPPAGSPPPGPAALPDGSPEVGRDFESSVPGLFVTPPPAEARGFSLRRVGVATDQPGP